MNTIVVITQAADYTGEKTPIALHADGCLTSWSDSGAAWDGAGRLTFQGNLYRWERRLQGERQEPDGTWVFGDVYRLLQGWQVLISSSLDGSNLAPAARFPYESRAQASAVARQVVTENLANYSTKLVAVLVWQDGDALGEPVARLDGRNHDRHEAVSAILARHWLPWDWEAEEAEPPQDEKRAGSAANTPAPVPGSAETNPHQDTTQPAESQAITLTVHYKARPPLPAETFATGQLVTFHDGNGNRPPAHSLAEIRLWLSQNGYRPDYTHWTVAARSTTRAEVYTLAHPAQQAETICYADLNRLAEAAGCRAPVITDDMRQRWLAQAAGSPSREPWQPDPFYRHAGNLARLLPRVSRGPY